MTVSNISFSRPFTWAAETLGNAITSPAGQVMVGLGLGIAAGNAAVPLTLKALKILNLPASYPFLDLSLIEKIILTPVATVFGPVAEEIAFRGDIQEGLTMFFGGPNNVLARIQSLFCTSVLFGLVHFVNALVFQSNPLLFLPQVIYAMIMGLAFGCAKELTGNLYLPIGMHIGNNSMAWIQALLH